MNVPAIIQCPLFIILKKPIIVGTRIYIRIFSQFIPFLFKDFVFLYLYIENVICMAERIRRSLYEIHVHTTTQCSVALFINVFAIKMILFTFKLLESKLRELVIQT